MARPRPFYPLLPDAGRVRTVEHQLGARHPLRLRLERTNDGRQVEGQRPQRYGRSLPPPTEAVTALSSGSLHRHQSR